MTVVFATTLSREGSTVIGRTLPLAEQLSRRHKVYVLVLDDKGNARRGAVEIRPVGQEPFRRTEAGKQRLSGLGLMFSLLSSALKTAGALYRLKPDAVVIVKPLPHNTLGVRLWTVFNKKKTVILDADDFELSANVLSSFAQRAAVHWAERQAVQLACRVTAASPFLKDHFDQLARNRGKSVVVPTGIPKNLMLNGRQADGCSLPGWRPIMLYIGSVSLSSGHRIDLLPDMLALVQQSYPTIELHIAGGGDDVQKIKDEFIPKRLQARVHWLGPFKPRQAAAFLAKACLVLDPVDASVSNRAKSSFRALAAAAFGLPVVTSNVGLRPLLVPPQFHARFFARPGNAKSYAGKILYLLGHPLNYTDRQTLRAHAGQFTWDKLAPKFEDLLTS